MLLSAFFAGLLSIFATLTPVDVPGDLTRESLLAEAPDEALFAVHLSGLAYDGEALETAELWESLIIGELLPAGDEYSTVLDRHDAEELIKLLESEVLLLGLPWEPRYEWDDSTAFYLRLTPHRAETLSLLGEFLEEGLKQGELELVEAHQLPRGTRVYQNYNDDVFALDGENFYYAEGLELLTHVNNWRGGLLVEGAAFREAFGSGPLRSPFVFYVDLAELLARGREREAELWAMYYDDYRFEDDPYYYPMEPPQPTKLELSMDKLSGRLSPCGRRLLIDLSLTPEGLVEDPLYRGLAGPRRRPALAGLVPAPCLAFVELQYDGSLTDIGYLYDDDFANREETVVMSVLNAIQPHLEGGYGLSLHAIPGASSSAELEDFFRSNFSLDFEYSAPRLIFYASSPNPAAALSALESALRVHGLDYVSRGYGDAPGLEILPEQNDYYNEDSASLHLFPLPGYLGLTLDAASAEWIVERFGGPEHLAGDEGFATRIAAFDETAGLLFYLDPLKVALADGGPEAVESLREILGEPEPLGLRLGFHDNRLAIDTDMSTMNFLTTMLFGFSPAQMADYDMDDAFYFETDTYYYQD